MTKIIFTRGIQASGKSTWAKEWCKEHKDWALLAYKSIMEISNQTAQS